MALVVHINARLSEGGAARVAKSISVEAQKFGYESIFAYGNGPHGRISPLHVSHVTHRLSNQISFAANIFSHNIFGKESRNFSKFASLKLRDLLSKVDIVHIHVAHSYFLYFPDLINELVHSNKPIVWTSHDQWLMTGRCAQPGTCQMWRDGCRKCPNLKAYPPSIIDSTKEGFEIRRREMNRLERNNQVRHIACATWLANEMMSAGYKNITTINNSIDREFWSYLPKEKVAGGPIRNLFICNDLRDKTKIDWATLEKIAQNDDQELTIVGDNMQSLQGRFHHLGSTNDRGALAKIFASHQRLIFTSRVDYFPLTLMEGLASGLEVLAIDSPAAREFSWHPNLCIFRSYSELIDYAHKSDLKPDQFKKALLHRESFSPALLGEKYSKVYGELLA